MHLSAWKGNSQKFPFTEFYEVRHPQATPNSGGFGDPATGDFIDGEVAFGLEPTSVGLEPRCREFGFQLRNDDRGPAHQGMLDLLRDAFVNELSVRVDYQQDSLPDGTPKQHSKPFRITVLRGI
jgi:hypothetical protein